jgi:hypothetical protein
MGFLVLGWVLTPSGQHSVPVQRAARKARQKSSSCCRLLRIIRSSSAVLDTLSFHLIMTPSPYHPFTRTYRRCGSSLCCSILTSRALMATLLRRVLQLNCTKTVLPLLLRWTTDISACRVFRLSPKPRTPHERPLRCGILNSACVGLGSSPRIRTRSRDFSLAATSRPYLS